MRSDVSRIVCLSVLLTVDIRVKDVMYMY